MPVAATRAPLRGGVSNALRRRRFAWLRELIAPVPRPVRILDVGGTEAFWRAMGLEAGDGVSVMILNLTEQPEPAPHVSSVVGDARDLSRFADAEFDLVFSNSVIEHVGSLEDQRRMAHEVRRVGRRFFVQTPNRYFPIEPHFVFPLFQFLPLAWRAFLVRHLRLGFVPRISDPTEARARVASIRLLTRAELAELFPGAAIRRERVLGLTKSFVVCGGLG